MAAICALMGGLGWGCCGQGRRGWWRRHRQPGMEMDAALHACPAMLGVCQRARTYTNSLYVVDMPWMSEGERRRRRVGTRAGPGEDRGEGDRPWMTWIHGHSEGANRHVMQMHSAQCCSEGKSRIEYTSRHGSLHLLELNALPLVRSWASRGPRRRRRQCRKMRLLQLALS